MKKVLFRNLMLISCGISLNGCGYLFPGVQLMFDGSCADWNCSKPTQRWERTIDDCENRNLEVVKQKFGYKDYREVIFSEIGQKIQIPYQCRHNNGRYDIRKDKQNGYLFSTP